LPVTLVLVLSDPTAAFLGRLEHLPSDTEVIVGDSLAAFGERTNAARVLVNCFRPLEVFREAFLNAPNLRWVHSLRTGVEDLLFPELAASPVKFTTSRGAGSRALAEFAIAGALFFSKKFGDMRRHQSEGAWVRQDVGELYGKTMGLVGYGSIGAHIAILAKAFGMRVVGCRRHPELSANSFGPHQLPEMLSLSDFVVVCAPLTPETCGMIGKLEIDAMKSTAVLINIGRGPIVVEDALLDALRRNRIQGAVLDVFDREPLPAGHAFYALDNVLISPHSAYRTDDWRPRAMDVFIDNFQRFMDGEPLRNVVDKTAGY
jgi:phosphoglycerate dehydrogenase-like enzyme